MISQIFIYGNFNDQNYEKWCSGCNIDIVFLLIKMKMFNHEIVHMIDLLPLSSVYITFRLYLI